MKRVYRTAVQPSDIEVMNSVVEMKLKTENGRPCQKSQAISLSPHQVKMNIHSLKYLTNFSIPHKGL